MSLFTTWQMIGQASPLMYVLPVAGTMLVFYGIYQVVADSKGNSQKRVRDRLKGERTKADTASESLLRRSPADASKSIAEAVLGKLKVAPKLQTMLNQADLDWSASGFMFNVGA